MHFTLVFPMFFCASQNARSARDIDDEIVLHCRCAVLRICARQKKISKNF